MSDQPTTDGHVDEAVARQWLHDSDDAAVTRQMDLAAASGLSRRDQVACFLMANEIQSNLRFAIHAAGIREADRWAAAELAVALDCLQHAKKCGEAVGDEFAGAEAERKLRKGNPNP